MHRIDFEKLKPGEILYKITDVGIIPCVIEDIDTAGYSAEITFKNGDRARLSQRTDTWRKQKNIFYDRNRSKKAFGRNRKNKRKEEKNV